MLKVTEQENVLVAEFDNYDRFNAVIYQDVKEQLNNLLKPHTNLILNLNGVKFIDSSGFGAMLSVFKTARKNESNFKICGISPDILELVKLMKLHNVFEIHDQLDDCLNSFKN